MAEDEIADYQSECHGVLCPRWSQTFNPDKRHILVTHYYVTGSDNEDYEFTSETNSRVGGLKGITATICRFLIMLLGPLALARS